LIFGDFFENLSRKFKFLSNRTRIKGTLHEDPCTFFVISRAFLLRMRNVSDKHCRENQNTYFVFSNFFSKIVPFRRKCEKYVERGRSHDYGACALHAGYIRLQTHTLRRCNTHFFSTATMVSGMRLIFT